MIVYSDQHRPRHVLEAQLRNVSQSWLDKVNRNRRRQGLEVLFPEGRPWLRQAAQRQAPPKPTRPTLRSLPQYVMVCRGGAIGDIGRGRMEPEVIEPGAFSDSTRAIADGSAPFVLRGFGHRSRAIDAAGSPSFYLAPIFRHLPVAIWRPDPRNPAHVDASDAIESGSRGLSIEFHAEEAKWIDGVRHIFRARLTGVAICGPDERPCYPGSMAVAADCRPSHLSRSILRVVGLCGSVSDGVLGEDEVEAAIRRLEV